MTPTEARALAQLFDGYHLAAALRSLADQVEALEESERASLQKIKALQLELQMQKDGYIR